MRACQEPGCKKPFTRKHTWENMHYCPLHRANIDILDRLGDCAITPTKRYLRPATTQAGFMERFMQ